MPCRLFSCLALPVVALALVGCPSSDPSELVPGASLAITDVPEPLAPCGDATITVELSTPVDGLARVDWALDDLTGMAALDGSGTTRTFLLPAADIAAACPASTCRPELSATLTLGGAELTAVSDVVILSDADPAVEIDGASPDVLESPVVLDPAALPVVVAELELSDIDPEVLTVEARACPEGPEDTTCIVRQLDFDGGGDWRIGSAELTTCIDDIDAGTDIGADWDLWLRVYAPGCEAPLHELKFRDDPLRFVVDDCDGDGLFLPDGDTLEGDCDDLEVVETESVGVVLYPDLDEDGHGDDEAMGFYQCPQDPPPGFPTSEEQGDCDDTDDAIGPHITDDTCDGLDQNCLQGPDDEAPSIFLYPDEDGDGWGFNYGTIQVVESICALPYPEYGPQGDCVDNPSDPTALEVNAGFDEDPLTPFDDNCDRSAACGADCDTEREILLAGADGLYQLTDIIEISPQSTLVRSWTETPNDVVYLDIDANARLDALVITDDSVVLERDLADSTGASEVLAVVGGGEAVVGDFDQDGIQDVAVGTDGEAYIWWGDVAFSATDLPTELGLGDQVGVADFDLDGCDDLVVLDAEEAGNYEVESRVQFGQPDGNGGCMRTFTPVTVPTNGAVDFAIGQLDGSPVPELVIAQQFTGSILAPTEAPDSLLLTFSGQLPNVSTFDVPGARAVAISDDLRLAVAHEPVLAQGISVWESDGSAGVTQIGTLPMLDADRLIWFNVDSPTTSTDLFAFTTEPMAIDRLYRNADPAEEEMLSFDIPVAGVRFVPHRIGNGHTMGMLVSRHPDLPGLDGSRWFTFSVDGVPTETILPTSTHSAAAPFDAFGPTHWTAPFPPQHLPETSVP